jgi:hypothetical protein
MIDQLRDAVTPPGGVRGTRNSLGDGLQQRAGDDQHASRDRAGCVSAANDSDDLDTAASITPSTGVEIAHPRQPSLS